MYKAIIFSRVSTKEQNYDPQTEDVKEYALKLYKESEVKMIEYQESGSKLADDDRQGLIDLKGTIEDPDNDIECVFIAELTRLSRRPETLYTWTTYFIKQKINLRIQDTKQALFDKDGKVDESVKNSIIVFCTHVERDNRNRVQKCIVGRRNKAKRMENVYTGGSVPYGYQYDKNTKKLDFHPEEAQIVVEIFELYRTGKLGYQKIYLELKKKGHVPPTPSTIGNILRNKDYTGESREAKAWKILIDSEGKALQENNKIIKIDINHIIKITKYEIQILDEHENTIKTIPNTDEITEKTVSRFKKSFKKIIEPHVFEECRKIAEKNNTNLSKTQTVYFAHRLIKCLECGGILKPLKPKMLYRCQHSYNVIEEKNCRGKDSININVIDWLLWHLSIDKEITFRENLNINQIEEWEKEIKINQSKLDTCDKRYQNLEAENRKPFEKLGIFTEQQITEYARKLIQTNEKSKKEWDQIGMDKKEYIKEIDRLSRIVMVSKTLKPGQEPEIIPFPIAGCEVPENLWASPLKSAVENTTDKQRYDIIHMHIKEVRVYNQPKGVKRIEIDFFDGSETKTFFYAGLKKDKSKQLYYFSDTIPNVEQYLEYTTRFERTKTTKNPKQSV